MTYKTSYRRTAKNELICSLKKIVFAFLLAFIAGRAAVLQAQDNEKLLDEYVKAKGTDVIVFDKGNIKQFWIDKSVVSRDKKIEIMLSPGKKNPYESVPLKLQFVNVDETMDCTVDVISENPDVSFTVVDNSLQRVATSVSKDDFIQYHVSSAVVHMEDTLNDSFSLVFSSAKPELVSIHKIVLSFSANKNTSFLSSSQTIKLSEENLIAASNDGIKTNEDGSFALKGEAYLNKKIFVADRTFKTSIKVRNDGEADAMVYVGYKPFTKQNVLIRRFHYPTGQDNKIMKVVSSQDNSASIIVDTYPKWEKGSYLAVGAKEDMSDLPNFNMITIVNEVKELDDGKAEIILNTPRKIAPKTGETLRVHFFRGGYLYTIQKRLKPGEETVFTSTTKMSDVALREFSFVAFPKETYYVIPVVTSAGITVLEYTVSF